MDQFTKASINMYAILRNLTELCEMDEAARNLIAGKDIQVQLNVNGGIEANLHFHDGKVDFKRGQDRCDIKLYFKSPEHLNNMFEGKANPTPLKGLTKIKFLTNEFTALTDRLAYFLKPTDELLKDETYFKINAYLTAYTAFYALAEIANNDRVGKINAKRIPDGTINIAVDDGPSLHLNIKDGRMEAQMGLSKTPRAIMCFHDLVTASNILNGKSDIYSAIGARAFEIRGYIPMLDNLNKLLDQVPGYVK